MDKPTEYIKREDALSRKQPMLVNGKKLWIISRGAISAIPAADVVEVVHASWELIEPQYDDEDQSYKCTHCGFTLVFPFSNPQEAGYLGCPHCFARMDGDAHD